MRRVLPGAQAQLIRHGYLELATGPKQAQRVGHRTDQVRNVFEHVVGHELFERVLQQPHGAEALSLQQLAKRQRTPQIQHRIRLPERINIDVEPVFAEILAAAQMQRQRNRAQCLAGRLGQTEHLGQDGRLRARTEELKALQFQALALGLVLDQVLASLHQAVVGHVGHTIPQRLVVRVHHRVFANHRLAIGQQVTHPCRLEGA